MSTPPARNKRPGPQNSNFGPKVLSNHNPKHGGWFGGVNEAEIVGLSAIESIGPVTWQKIYRGFSGLAEFLKSGHDYLRQAGITDNQIKELDHRERSQTPRIKLLKQYKIKLLTLDDPDYPPLLREIPDPPLWLFSRGNLNQTKTSLTVVGSRLPTGYGLAVIKNLMPDELASQLCLVSGLAYGIDKAVHQRSLEAGGETVAVLAGGLDRIYPIDHTNLADKIIAHGGALISEYPPLSRPYPGRFPVRNRILAGLSVSTLVIEAKIRSGSLTTAKSALDYNRDVLAVPGPITSELSSGPNFLLKSGASLIDSPEALASYLNLDLASPNKGAVDSQSEEILNLLTRDPLTVDAIMAVSGLNIEQALGALTQLELLGLVYQPVAGSYQSKSKIKNN